MRVGRTRRTHKESAHRERARRARKEGTQGGRVRRPRKEGAQGGRAGRAYKYQRVKRIVRLPRAALVRGGNLHR